jgi:hypothetical protein
MCNTMYVFIRDEFKGEFENLRVKMGLTVNRGIEGEKGYFYDVSGTGDFSEKVSDLDRRSYIRADNEYD